MKSIFALVFVVLSISSASAADLPARPYTKAPALIETPVNWNGFYVGGQIGGGWGHSIQYFTANSGGSIAPFDVSGIAGGVTGGYNWQLNPNWLIGFETDWSAANMKGTGSSVLNIYNCGQICENRVTSFGTVRGRLGYTFGNALIYGTGGLVYGHLKNNLNNDILGSADRTGWTAGGGIEYMFARNWSVKAEYLYLNFDDFNWTNALGCQGLNCSTYNHVNVARLGLNYNLSSLLGGKY